MKKIMLMLGLLSGVVFLSACSTDNGDVVTVNTVDVTDTLEQMPNVTDDGNVITEGYDVDYETQLIAQIFADMEELKDASGYPFGDIVPGTFSWWEIFGDDYEELVVDGYVMEAFDLGDNVWNLDVVFQDLGWTMSETNMADGMTESMAGYYKDGIGCQIYWTLNATEEELETLDFESVTSNVKVSCGSIAVG